MIHECMLLLHSGAILEEEKSYLSESKSWNITDVSTAS